MAKETLTEVITVADSETSKTTVAPKERSIVGWIAENGIFVFTALLIVVALVFVDGFASLGEHHRRLPPCSADWHCGGRNDLCGDQRKLS